MALTSSGIGSNLPIDDLISKLMSVESRPLQQLAVKEATMQAKISSLGQIKGALSTLQTALKSLQDSSKFNAVQASTTASDYLGVSATNSAASASYSVKVLELAQAQKLATTATYSSTTTAIGGGSLTFSFGATSDANVFTLNPDSPPKTVTIPAGATLAGIRDAVNKANVGVSASIVNDGSGNRLVFSSGTTGTNSTLKIDVGAGSDAALSDFAYTPGATSFSQVQEAKDAKINLDGMVITKQSNIISDAVEGVTFTLKKKHADTDAAGRVDVSRSSADVKKNVEAFVKSFNELGSTLNSLSKVDTSSSPAKGTARSAPPLAGDSVVGNIRSQLRNVFNTPQDVDGVYKMPAEIGITFNRSGELTLDSAKLQKAIETSPEDVMKLFGSAGKPSDANVSFLSATGNTKTGTYDVKLTAVQNGFRLGEDVVPANINVNTAANFTLSINGTSTNSLTLPVGAYTPSSLASTLQSVINVDTKLVAKGLKVTVGVDASGKLLLSSNTTGTSSTVEVLAGGDLAAVKIDPAPNTTLNLFSTGAGTAGADKVAGTIGGYAALADGKNLKGAVGTPVEGMLIAINGGATGSRGSIEFTKGFAFALDGVLAGLLDSKGGAIAAKTDGLNASVKRIGEQRERLNTQLNMTESRLRKQFTALDGMVGQFQSTSNYLSQQLAALAKSG